MKKNISVNLFGTLYNIDEDAYKLLQDYEDSVRRYFERKGEDDEVAQDIERRVAELCEELRRQGIDAITIEHVQAIIRRIGEPGEMDGGEAEATGNPYARNPENPDTRDSENPDTQKPENPDTQKPENPDARKLYRDPDDCMLGGVMSGLAHYFGGSPTALRLLMVLLALFVASIPWLLVCYLVACVLIPKAVTPEDKLRMMGKPVNLESIGEGVINSVGEGVKVVQQRGCLDQILSFIVLLMKIALFVIGGFFAIVVGFVLFVLLSMALVALVAIIASFTVGTSSLWFINGGMPFEMVSQMTMTSFWTTIVALIFVCGLPLFCIVHGYQRFRGKVQPWSTWTKLIVLLLWLVAVGLVVSFGCRTYQLLEQDDRAWHAGVQYRDEEAVQDAIDDAGSEAEAVSDTIY